MSLLAWFTVDRLQTIATLAAIALSFGGIDLDRPDAEAPDEVRKAGSN